MQKYKDPREGIIKNYIVISKTTRTSSFFPMRSLMTGPNSSYSLATTSHELPYAQI